MTEQTKVALVTGSALNIGRAIAQHLARDGFRVMVTARQSEDGCRETVRLVNEAGGRPTCTSPTSPTPMAPKP